MRFLLDTMVLSEGRKRRPAPAVAAWLDAVPEYDLGISVLTLGELERGVAAHTDAEQRHRLQAWLEDRLRLRFASRILPVDETVASLWGRLSGEAARAGRTVPLVDGLLVATARRHGLTLVTRNLRDVEGLGAQVLDPWQG